LAQCQWVELEMGRERIEKWGARIIDIDILYYDNLELEESNLSIPHPGIAMRKFTLIALNEIIPNEIHPILHLSQKELLDMCPDKLKCETTDIHIDL
jgi:2-amino-4-hydroxy-6-hydroxymethyldihydropteridine diphosphokinase